MELPRYMGPPFGGIVTAPLVRLTAFTAIFDPLIGSE